MHNSFRNLRPVILLTLVASTFAVGCLTDPSGSSYVPGYLALAPSFESGAAGIVDVASIHVVIIRDQDSTVAVDTVITHQFFSDDVDLRFTVLVSSSSETFTLTIECLSPTEEVVFRAGPLTVTANTSGADDVVPEDVMIAYVGVGFDAADIDVPGSDIFYVHMGNTLTLEAVALDSSGNVIAGTPIRWTSSDTNLVKFPVPAIGTLEAGLVRGWVDVTAELLTGPTDIVEVYVEPVPNEITVFSGDNQTGLVATELPVVLEVQVNAPDGPVEGLQVDFNTQDGGSFSGGSLITDADGYAWTRWTLGRNAGQQTATVTVNAYPTLQTTFTATAVTPVAPTLIFTVQPSSADAATTITPAVVVTAYDQFGAVDTAFADAVIVAIATNPANGILSGTRSVTAVAGVATFADLSIDSPGSGYTLEATATGYLAATSAAFDITGTTPPVPGRITWTGAGDGSSWSDANNWDLGRVPGVLDSAMITQDTPTSVDVGNATVAYLHVGGNSNTQQQSLSIGSASTLQIDSGAVIDQSGVVGSAGGAITGAGYFTVLGQMECVQSCVLGGTGTTVINNTATITLESAVIDGRLISNSGTMLWQGTNTNVTVDNGGYIVNNGVFDITAEGALAWGGTGANPQLINNGAIHRTLTATATSIAIDLVSNSTSSLQVIAGNLILSGNAGFVDATIEVGDGGSSASLSFAGSSTSIDAQSMVTIGPDGLVQFLAGSATISGSYDYSGAPNGSTSIGGGTAAFNNTSTAVMPNLLVNGGTLAGTGNVLVPGVFSWDGGRVEGTGAIQLNTTSTGAIGGTGLQLSERTIVNEAIIYLNGQGPTLSNSAAIQNLATGTVNFMGDYSLRGSGELTNEGTVLKSGGGVGPTQIELNFINNGTIDVQVGTIAFVLGDFTHSDGAIIQGNGTIDLSAAGAVTFDGDVNPGTSPGILSFIGDATPSALSTANIEIGGLIAGTEHDQVTVSGTFIAGGSVNVTLINSFRPAIGDQFTVLTFAGRSGTFDNIVGLDIGGGLVLDTVWTSTSLTLETRGVAPGHIVFAGDSAGGLSTGVFTVNPDGTGLAQPYTTTSLGYGEVYPRWSPDRERIAFTNRAGYTPPNPNQLYMMHATGDSLYALVTDTSTYVPRWSPNGNHIAFECGDGYSEVDVCVITGVAAALPSLYGIGDAAGKWYVTDFDQTNWNNGPWVFAWDPMNYDRIAVVRDSVPPVGGQGQSMIYTMLYDGTGVQPLVTAARVLDAGNGPLQINGNLDWSYDGLWLVFSAADPQGGQNIYRINRDGTNLIPLTGTVDQDADPLISPDGTEILFGRDLGCDYDAWIMNSDGSNAHAITAEHVCDWNLETLGADWSPDGQEIVITGFESPYNNVFIYVIPRTTTAATYFTDRAVIGPLRGQGADAYEVQDIQPRWRP